MKLHRADTEPDWQAVPAAGRNQWQRLAAGTHGLVTPGNITSLLGLTLVAAGLYYVAAGQLWAGLAVVAAGRLLDVADGALAEATGTKSPLGESIDASFDKAAAFAALIVFTTAGILPLWFTLIIGIENGITALLSIAGKTLKRAIHPERSGKIGGAVEWAALLGFIFGAATTGSTATALAAAAYVLAAISMVLNAHATIRYAQTFRAQRNQER